MAENKKETLEVKEERIEKDVKAIVDTGLSFVDSYENRRSNDDEAEITEEKTNVVYTNVPVDHIKGKSAASNREWHDLSTTWNYVVTGRNGKPVSTPLTIRYALKKSFSEKYAGKSLSNIVGIICGDEKSVPLDIICNEFRDSTTGALRKTYSPQISYRSPEGAEIACPLGLYGESDKVTWNLLIEELKKAGVLA